MSVFDFPRINVAGTYLVDPPTANNDVPPGSYVSDTRTVRAVSGPMDDAEFSSWITGLNEEGLLRCSWNYYGDLTLRFLDVRVTGVQLAPGRLLVGAAEDPLIGGKLSLTDAVMCDIDPEGIDATQIFASSLQLESAGGFRDRLFISRPPTRATLRQLNFCRNVSFTSAIGPTSSAHAGGGSAIFQFSVEVRPEDLVAGDDLSTGASQQFHKLLPEAASPGTTALAEVLRAPSWRGLVFRMTLYMTHPLLSDPVVADAFAKGQPLHNPAYGLVCGTLAPWRRSEPASVTLGRYLRPAGTYPNPYLRGASYEIGPAVACHDADADLLSVDFVNALPEDGIDGDKFDLSPLSLGVRPLTPPGTDPAKNPAPVTTLAVVVNDRETYLRSGGLWDLPLGGLGGDERRLIADDGFELVVQSGRGGSTVVLLSESEYMVASDCAASYLEEPPPGHGWEPSEAGDPARVSDNAFDGEVPVFVHRRGRPAEGAVELSVELWQMGLRRRAVEADSRTPRLLQTTSLVVQDGFARLDVRPPPEHGIYDYRLVPPGWWPAIVKPGDFVSETGEDARTMVRVLPYDDYSRLSDDEVNFPLVYSEVLRYYQLLCPAMGERLDLSDPTLWTTPSAAHYLLKVTAPELWATPLSMPRTRDLSAPRRALLQRFCRLVTERSAAGSKPAPPGPPASSSRTDGTAASSAATTAVQGPEGGDRRAAAVAVPDNGAAAAAAAAGPLDAPRPAGVANLPPPPLRRPPR